MNFLIIRVLAVAALLALQSFAVSAQSKSGYHVVNKFTLGGDGGWDYLYVDSQARRVYISRSTHVMVVDADSGQIIGDIADTSGVHGVAIVSDLNKGYTSNGRDNSVTVFDLKTLKALTKIPVGKNPDAITYDPVSKRVFTFNGTSHDATAIDVKTDTVAGTITLDGKPETGVPDGKGYIFVNIEDKSIVTQLDTRKLTVENRWPLAPGEEPTGMALDRKHRRLIIGCGNKMMVVMNADDGKIVTTISSGNGTDAAGFDPETQLAFTSNGEGNLTVVHMDAADKFTFIENVTTQRGARTMAVDQKTHRVFLVTAEYGATPAPTAERPRPRPSVVPGTFTLLVIGK